MLLCLKSRGLNLVAYFSMYSRILTQRSKKTLTKRSICDNYLLSSNFMALFLQVSNRLFCKVLESYIMSFNVKKICCFSLGLIYALCLENAPLQAMEIISSPQRSDIVRNYNSADLGRLNINKKTIAYIQAANNTLSVLEYNIVNVDENYKEKIKIFISFSLAQINNSKITNISNVNEIMKNLDNNIKSIENDFIQFNLKPLEKFEHFVSIELKAKNLEELALVKDKVEQFSEEEIYCLLNKNQPIGKKNLVQSRQAVWNSVYKKTDNITDKNVIILSNLICDSGVDPLILDKNFSYMRIYNFLENICKNTKKSINKEKALYYSARFICEKIDKLDLNLTEEKQKKLAWKKLDKAKDISDCNYIKTFMAHLIVNKKYIPNNCDNLNEAYQLASTLLGNTEKKQANIEKPLSKVQKTSKSKKPLTLKIKSHFDKKRLLDKCLENIEEDSKKRKQDVLLAADKTDSSSDSSDGSRKKRKAEVAPRKIYYHLTDADKERILELQMDEGLNQREIAEEIGCSSAAVGVILRNNG